jgi:hypothetical protein
MRRVLVLLVAGTLLSGFAATYASVKQPMAATVQTPGR